MERHGIFFLKQHEDNKSVFKQQEEISSLKTKIHTVLFKASSVFPFDFFPNTIIIDPIKVTIISRAFFQSEEVTSLHINDIENVIVQTAPIFGKLSIISRFMTQRPVKIAFLWKRQAVRAHDILQGLLTSAKQNIDITTNNPDTAEAIGEINRNAA